MSDYLVGVSVIMAIFGVFALLAYSQHLEHKRNMSNIEMLSNRSAEETKRLELLIHSLRPQGELDEK